MKATRLSILVAMAGLAGCASVPPPPGASGVVLAPVPSKAVALYQPKLAAENGQLRLDGWVYRQFGAQTTAQTHIDVAFLDTAGRELRTELARFEPPDLRRGSHKMANRGHYVVPIPVMPRGTATIQVRAHDAPEHQP